jgi:nucleoside-diphosphate-sugar epimerase
VDALLDRDDEVTCLVRSEEKFNRLFPNQKPDVIWGNLDDEEALRAGCESADVILHSAALTSARNRDEFFAVNVEATRRLLDIVSEVRPDIERFVYLSSQAAAGPSRKGSPKSETDPATPVSDYGASKLAGEQLVRRCGLPWTIVRPPGVYGPRDTSFLTVFRIARLGVVPSLASADQELSLIYISDLVSALLAVTASGAAEAQTYFACHPEILTSRSLAGVFYRAVKGILDDKDAGPVLLPLPRWVTRAVMQITGTTTRALGGRSVISADKAKELLAEAWTCSPAAIQTDVGWNANTDLVAGARETVRWYREQGML